VNVGGTQVKKIALEIHLERCGCFYKNV